MNDLINAGNNEIVMTSVEVVVMINEFRKLEDNKKELQHNDFMKKIRKEIETMENLKLDWQGNFSPSNFINRGKEYPCYKLNRDGVLIMTMSESTLVRFKVIEYINALENKLNELTHLDSKRLELLNAEKEVTKLLALREIESIVRKEGFAEGYEKGKTDAEVKVIENIVTIQDNGNPIGITLTQASTLLIEAWKDELKGMGIPQSTICPKSIKGFLARKDMIVYRHFKNIYGTLESVATPQPTRKFEEINEEYKFATIRRANANHAKRMTEFNYNIVIMFIDIFKEDYLQFLKFY